MSTPRISPLLEGKKGPLPPAAVLCWTPAVRKQYPLPAPKNSFLKMFFFPFSSAPFSSPPTSSAIMSFPFLTHSHPSFLPLYKPTVMNGLFKVQTWMRDPSSLLICHCSFRTLLKRWRTSYRVQSDFWVIFLRSSAHIFVQMKIYNLNLEQKVSWKHGLVALIISTQHRTNNFLKMLFSLKKTKKTWFINQMVAVLLECILSILPKEKKMLSLIYKEVLFFLYTMNQQLGGSHL